MRLVGFNLLNGKKLGSIFFIEVMKTIINSKSVSGQSILVRQKQGYLNNKSLLHDYTRFMENISD